MNKSQKNSMVALVITMLLLVFCVTIPFAWFNEARILKLSPLFFFVLIYLVMGLSVIFLRKKQNHTEVDYDERIKQHFFCKFFFLLNQQIRFRSPFPHSYPNIFCWQSSPH